MNTFIEYIVRVVTTKRRIMAFDTEDEAIHWAKKRKEKHLGNVAKVEIVRVESIIKEEVLTNV